MPFEYIFRAFGVLDREQQTVPGPNTAVSVSRISDLPLTGGNNNNPATAGNRAAPPIAEWQMTNYRSASSNYFRAAEIPLKAGKPFEERDGNQTEVMISDNLAARLWPGQNAVGRPLRIYSIKSPLKVVGVVGSVHAASLMQAPTMMVYFPDLAKERTGYVAHRSNARRS